MSGSQYSSISLINANGSGGGGQYTSLASQMEPLSGWTATGTTSAEGHAVMQKTMKNGRTMWGVSVGGKVKRRSRYQIETGKKIPKCNDKPKAPKKAKATKKKAGGGKKKNSEIGKARNKFNKRSKLKKAIDRSIQADHVVTKSRDYHPGQNDFKGVDTKK